MSKALTPSVVTLPNVAGPYPSILDFLARSFPHVARRDWLARLHAGNILDEQSNPISITTAYTPGKRLYYFRATEVEPVVPFLETIVFQNEELLVACKPHFLPVTPGGPFVNECLLNRLRSRTGIMDLAPLHRLDRDTAGLVLFSVNRKTRGRYHDLFMHGHVTKFYLAVVELESAPALTDWIVENRIVRGEPRFRMKIATGIVNARSHITLLDYRAHRGLFGLSPQTGKTHQLRLHMSSLGFPILNDRVYPDLQPPLENNFEQPLQLLAKRLEFQDPVTGERRVFESERELLGSLRAGRSACPG